MGSEQERALTDFVDLVPGGCGKIQCGKTQIVSTTKSREKEKMMSEQRGLTEEEIGKWWDHVEQFCSHCAWSRGDVAMCPVKNNKCVFYVFRMYPLMIKRNRIKISDFVIAEPQVETTTKKHRVPNIR